MMRAPRGGRPLNASEIPLTISWFPTSMPKGPAIGDPERTTWGEFANVFWWRREGDKDGPCFIPARFTPEATGRHVRRLGANLAARTAVALDCETHKASEEIPPPLDEVVARVRREAWAAVIYTSHNHRPQAPRYRIVVPLSEEIDYELPASEVIVATLGLDGVTDTSKYTAASPFYLPSAEPDQLDHHDTVTIEGNPIDAAWMREAAGAILAGRQAVQDRIAIEARADAEKRRQAKIAAGFDPDASLIERLRSRFDLADVLLSHGYSHRKGKYRHPKSQSGCFGADIKNYGGIQRVYSHNAGDPLHRDNLPSWCGGVTALDAIDVTIIFDYGGDRTKALADLAQRFGLTKAEERRTIASLLFRLIRQQASQEVIEATAFAEGSRLGLSRADVIRIAVRVNETWPTPEAA
jgi:hypothetical protein